MVIIGTNLSICCIKLLEFQNFKLSNSIKKKSPLENIVRVDKIAGFRGRYLLSGISKNGPLKETTLFINNLD